MLKDKINKDQLAFIRKYVSSMVPKPCCTKSGWVLVVRLAKKGSEFGLRKWSVWQQENIWGPTEIKKDI